MPGKHADASTARRARAGKRAHRSKAPGIGGPLAPSPEAPPAPGDAWLEHEPGAAEALAEPAPAPPPEPTRYRGTLDDGLECPAENCVRISEREKRRCLRRACACQERPAGLEDLRQYAMLEQAGARRRQSVALAHFDPDDPLRPGWRR